jgi:hypothetical protein
MDDDLPTPEQARIRRRDRDMTAEERAPMNNASNKWFEQVIESQKAAADAAGTGAKAGKPRKTGKSRKKPKSRR